MKKLFSIIFITLFCIADLSWIIFDLVVQRGNPWFAILFLIIFGAALIGYYYLGSPFRENRPIY